MKAKYDIYIRKDLQPLLDNEPNMSGLINDLLTKHFKVEAKVVIKTPKDIPQALQQVSRPVTRPKLVDKTQEDVKNNSEPRFKTCKEGHPLDWRGKCFDKKCKYSK